MFCSGPQLPFHQSLLPQLGQPLIRFKCLLVAEVFFLPKLCVGRYLGNSMPLMDFVLNVSIIYLHKAAIFQMHLSPTPSLICCIV